MTVKVNMCGFEGHDTWHESLLGSHQIAKTCFLQRVTCEDAAGQTTEFMLGRVLPGQRTGGCECLLMLHVDDVENPGDELTFLKRRPSYVG